MQTSASTTPAIPPIPPIPPFPTQVVQGGPGGSRVVLLQPSTAGSVPQTPAELNALKTRRSEISSQLENVAARRKSLASQIEQSRNPASVDGMTERLKVMDQRIVSLESDLAETGRLLQLAPTTAFTSSAGGGFGGGGGDWQPNNGAVISISVVFILAVLMPLAITAARIWWRRATGTLPARQQKADTDRLDRLEGAVETVAIEMERVSEGQRFMTRILTEGRSEVPVFGAAANASRGEPLRVPAAGQSGN